MFHRCRPEPVIRGLGSLLLQVRRELQSTMLKQHISPDTRPVQTWNEMGCLPLGEAVSDGLQNP